MRTPIVWLAVSALVAACSGGGSNGPADTGERDGAVARTALGLQIEAVDFVLGLVIITNPATEAQSTAGHWLCHGEECTELDPQPIQPRSSVRFSEPELGDIDPAGGELGLYSSDDFDDPGSVLSYVAWGTSDMSRADVAIEGGVWGGEDPVPTDPGTEILVRVDASALGAVGWQGTTE